MSITVATAREGIPAIGLWVPPDGMTPLKDRATWPGRAKSPLFARRFELRRALVHLGALVEPGHISCPRGTAVADTAASPLPVTTCNRTPSLSVSLRPRLEVISGRTPELPPTVVRVKRRRRR